MTEVLTREKKAAWTAWRSAYKSGTGRKILRQIGIPVYQGFLRNLL